jgi:glycine oxidase
MAATKVDYIIVGLGLAGASVAWQLMQRGRSVAVFDIAADNRSSSQAAGLFNPVTGKLMSKTWLADEIFPALHNFYPEVEQVCRARFFYPTSIYIPFRSIEEQNDWMSLDKDSLLIQHIAEVRDRATFSDVAFDDLGGVLLKTGGYLHVPTYLQCVRNKLDKPGCLHGHFDPAKVLLTPDFVEYEDLRAGHLILCEGLHAKANPLTAWLPLHSLKGETLDIALDRELQVVLNRGIYIVPAGSNRYKVGATYERTNISGVTAAGRKDLEGRLRSLLRVPFTVTGQNWGLRPTTPDRRPILGALPGHQNVTVFNGLGTKGVSLAPYFSKVLADYLEGGVQIAAEVNISRFYALSSKSRD